MNKIIVFMKSMKKFGLDVLILSIGIILAQLIPIALQPFLKRTFSPEDFGTYDLYLKLFSIFVAMSSLKYENAILLPKKDADSKHVLYLCVIISACLFLLTLICFLIFHNYIIAKFEGFTILTLILLPIGVFSYSIFNILNMYLIRRKKFILSSSSKISRRTSEGLSQLLFGFFNYTKGLIVGDVFGNIIQGAFTYYKTQLITSFNRISYKKLKNMIIEYKDLPIYTLVPNLLNTFVLGSLTFLIFTKFDLEKVGYLEFTQKILSIPSVFLSIAISQVVFQRISELINKRKKIIPLLTITILVLFAFSLLLIFGIEFFGKELFIFIGGKQWEKSGEYAEILVYGSAMMLIFSPLGKVLIALRKYKINSLWEILKFIAIVAIFNIEYITINEYLKIYTIIIVIFYISYGIIILYYSNRYQIENQIRA